MSEERIIIQDVSILRIPDGPPLHEFHIWEPVKFNPSVYSEEEELIPYADVQTEMIHLKEYVIDGGTRFYLGMPDNIAGALGMQPEVNRSLEKDNYDLRCTERRLLQAVRNVKEKLRLEKVDHAYSKKCANSLNFWGRLGFLFSGVIFKGDVDA